MNLLDTLTEQISTALYLVQPDIESDELNVPGWLVKRIVLNTVRSLSPEHRLLLAQFL